MIRRKLNRYEFLLQLVTLSLPTLAYGFAAYVRFASGLVPLKSDVIGWYPYIGLVIATSVVWTISVTHYQLATMEGLFSSGGKTRRVFMACAVTEIIVLAITFFYRQTSFSRLFIWFGAVGLFFMTLIVRLFFRVYWSGKSHARGQTVRLLIIGADTWALQATHKLLAGQVMPCSVVGYVCLPGQSPANTNAPVYRFSQIKELSRQNEIDDVIVAVSPEHFGELSDLLAKLKCFCVPIRAIMEFGDGLAVRDKLFNFGGSLMLDLEPTCAESIKYLISKRVFDTVFSSVVMIVTGPFMLLIAAAIRLTSAGPVIFVQERVGLSGNTFYMYKFRTMKAELAGDASTRWTTENDPRCTAIGTFLRRTSLDELPQFFNVWRGDMSVVGPRPERPYFVQKFIDGIDHYNARHFFKAGITGWAQVNGWRGDSSIEKRLEFDLYYIRHWTFLFDLQIILLTMLRGLINKNAY